MTAPHPTPAAGGCYIRDDDTGVLTPAHDPKPVKPAAPAPIKPAIQPDVKGAAK